MQQAVQSLAAKGIPPRSFRPHNANIAVASHEGTDLIDDAGIWMDHAETILMLMLTDLESGKESNLVGDASRLSASLWAALAAVRMAHGVVDTMPSTAA